MNEKEKRMMKTQKMKKINRIIQWFITAAIVGLTVVLALIYYKF